MEGKGTLAVKGELVGSCGHGCDKTVQSETMRNESNVAPKLLSGIMQEVCAGCTGTTKGEGSKPHTLPHTHALSYMGG